MHFYNFNAKICYIQYYECSAEEKGILRDILVDILNLQHGLEDNLLVIQQIQQVDPGTGEDYKELALNTARQHIIDINSVYQQGLDWLKNDQACDTLSSAYIDEDIKVVPDINLDLLSSETKNNIKIVDQNMSGTYIQHFVSSIFLLYWKIIFF